MTACDRFMYSNLDIHAIADTLKKIGKWDEIHLRKLQKRPFQVLCKR